MKTFAAVVLAVSAAAAASVPAVAPGSGLGPGKAAKLLVYGSPAHHTRDGGVAALLDGALDSEAQGWRSLYDKPFVLAVQQDNKPEMAAFLVKGGLASLPTSEDMSFLHNVLRNADDKVGILLSATKFINVPQVEMPITKFFLPKDYTLAASARLHATNRAFPTMLLLNKADLKGFDISKLALIGDFNVYEDSVKVASDIEAPLAIIRDAGSSDMTIKRFVQPIHAIYGAQVSPKLGSYGYDYIIPSHGAIAGLSTPTADFSKYIV